MKLSNLGKKFLKKNGDKNIRKLVRKGGREGALGDFNKILVRAAKLLKPSH